MQQNNFKNKIWQELGLVLEKLKHEQWYSGAEQKKIDDEMNPQMSLAFKKKICRYSLNSLNKKMKCNRKCMKVLLMLMLKIFY